MSKDSVELKVQLDFDNGCYSSESNGRKSWSIEKDGQKMILTTDEMAEVVTKFQQLRKEIELLNEAKRHLVRIKVLEKNDNNL